MMTQATNQIERRTERGLGAQVAMTAITLAALGALVLWQAGSGRGTVPLSLSNGSTTAADDGTHPAVRVAEQRESIGAVERHTLVVASADEIPEAYARLVERLGALDGATPLVVTVVVGTAAPASSRSDCRSAALPITC